MMKKMMTALICVMLLCGCAQEETTDMNETIKDTTITAEDITDFYFTYDNINYNAFYQRYRFYTEDGRYMFFHETRERKDDYGPATEEDRTAMGTYELSEKEWKEFFALIDNGRVEDRSEEVVDGDDGPWLYIYTKNGPEEGQEYHFTSYGEQKDFESYCAKLAKR